MPSAEQEKPEDERSKWGTFKTFLIPYLGSSLKLAIAFLMAVVFLRAGDAAWNLIKDAKLITGEGTSTIIQMDLLQFLGFLLAWSLGLITVATWVTNWVLSEHGSRLKSFHEIARLREEVDRDIQEREKVGNELDQRISKNIQEWEELKNEFEEVKNRFLLAQEQIEPMAAEIQELNKENNRLKGMNQRLSGLLTEESKKLLY